MERQRTHLGWESPRATAQRAIFPMVRCFARRFVFLHAFTLTLPCACTVIPVFLHPPQDVVAETGQDVAITCAAQGDPRPTITWVKVRGTALPEQHFNYFGFLKGLKETLLFLKLKALQCTFLFSLALLSKEVT